MQVMVPLTSKAFMPGELVHTNEILVLLGENYFLETSAAKAAQLADRRLSKCDHILGQVYTAPSSGPPCNMHLSSWRRS